MDIDSQSLHPEPEPVRLQVVGAVKDFPGVRALDGVDLTVRVGEVHALIGENGAGKSSLIKALAGVHRLDGGRMVLDGTPYEPANPHDALAAGIRVVHQELSNLPNLTIAENLFFERLPRRRGFVDYRSLDESAGRVLARVGLEVPPSTAISELSVAQKQLVEIARAVAADARLLVFDEPTASLTAPERRRLFALVQDLRQHGTSVVYISHHLEEVFELCDTATVLRNGRRVATHAVADLTPSSMVTLMVGREMSGQHPFPGAGPTDRPVLEVQDLRVGSAPPVSFTAHAGEILGFAGLIGSGRTEVMRAVFGADRRRAGRVRVDGDEVRIRHPRDAVRAGISFATEDRKHQGLVLPMGSDVNITLAALGKVTRGGWLRRRVERRLAARMAERMRVKAPTLRTPVGTLSGGNQQKVVLARWLFRDMRVLIIDEPTRGIDVGARHEVYELLSGLAEQGVAIVMVSSDLHELMGMCHRIVVLSRGAVAGEVARRDFDEERILTLAYSGYLAESRTGDAPSAPSPGALHVPASVPARTGGHP